MAKEFYRFNPLLDRNGNPSKYHYYFIDDNNFNVNSTLIEQIDFSSCRETTAEGRAIWLYIRLCQLLKYDEGYFYREYRNHPNDNPYESFDIAAKVTSDTPVTCFNFSRIAVNLMNQIDGVHALLIAVGGNRGHFRFGFYTDNISVDAEPTTPCNHFSDLARAKLGLKPQGLKAFNGGEMVQELINRLTLSMLISKRRETREYVKYLQQAQPITEPTIEIDSLVKKLQRINIDGNTAVQLLLNLNRCALIEPSQFVRAALLDKNNKIKPQLLISENKKLKRLNLNNLDITNLPVQECRTAVKNGTMLISEESYEKYYQLISSVESGENDKTQLPDNGDEKQ